MLQPGTRLGPYEIRALLGAGGMGEVYQGWDTRLDRFVAVKILPAHLAERPDLRERFEREAKATANLKHPNICVLYDVGRQELEEEDVAPPSRRPEEPAGGRRYTVHFLVMEYLEGETLSARLKRGPLPLEQVLQYAAEISDALDKAHRQGYTHRDIKPGNIMLVPTTASPHSPARGSHGTPAVPGSHGMISMPWARSEGKTHGTQTVPWLPTAGTSSKTATKLLDFGLAKFKQEIVKATLPASEMPTVPGTLTEHGTLLGTLHYMAPEQVESKDVDARADLFAFGAVVYEMATGKKAFNGESQASVIAKILEVEPPAMSSLDPPGQLSPPALDRVVKKCLRKDREDRWQSARDVTDELKWIKEGGGKQSTAEVAEAKSRAGTWRRAVPFALTALVAVLITAGVAIWNRPAPAPQPVMRFEVSLPANAPFGGIGVFDSPVIALSPDGSQLVYVGQARGGRNQLFLRRLDSLESNPIPGTVSGYSPFFSPDGQWIGFFADNSLKKISINGGAPVTLTRVQLAGNASWGENGTIVLRTAAGSSLQQISAEGGTLQPFTSLDGDRTHVLPEFLPGGKAVLFTAFTSGTAEGSQIVVQGFPTGERKVLVRGGSQPHYISSGHLVYARAGMLMAAPFDLERLEVTGPAVPILEGVFQSQQTIAQFSVSKAGSLVYVPGDFAGVSHRMVWVDRNGAEEALAAPPRNYGPLRLSPDGQRIATLIEGNVWVYDIRRDTLTRLTFEPSGSTFPAWTPDGQRITFHANKGGPSGLFWKFADGSGAEESLASSEHFLVPGDWSSDGKLFAFTEVHSATTDDLWVLSVEDRKAQLFLRTPFGEGRAKFSPDGRWLAYLSDESGRDEVYVQAYPGPGGKWQISSDGGSEIVWARNGEIFYRNGDRMMAVETTTEPTFSASRPRLLFEGRYGAGGGGGAGYDVTVDGQRFLMRKIPEQQEAATRIHVVLNWFEELRRRVPAAR